MSIHQTISIMEKDQVILDILRYCPYDILTRFKLESFAPGEVLFNQGEIYDSVCIIVDGKADIYMTVENGRKYSQATYTKGYFIGELEIFDQKPYVCFVEALTELKLLVLDRDSFIQWLHMDKHISFYIMRLMAEQYYSLSKKAGDDNLYSLKHRICGYLLSSIKDQKQNEATVNVIKPLSEQFAATERSINRILKVLKEKNIIEMTKHHVVIKDIQRLKSEVNSENTRS